MAYHQVSTTPPRSKSKISERLTQQENRRLDELLKTYRAGQINLDQLCSSFRDLFGPERLDLLATAKAYIALGQQTAYDRIIRSMLGTVLQDTGSQDKIRPTALQPSASSNEPVPEWKRQLAAKKAANLTRFTQPVATQSVSTSQSAHQVKHINLQSQSHTTKAKAKVTSKTDPPLGVSIEFIRSFLRMHAQPLNPDLMTTTDVCNSIVKPATLQQKCAYIELIANDKDETGKPYVGVANVFVSHAWKYKFADPVDVMEQHAKTNAEAYFWFDLFINNQHGTESVPQEWWATTFRESIRQIGAVLLVMSPWNNPIPVTRAWCLWEIMCAILGQPDVKLLIELPQDQRYALKQAVINDSKSVVQALADIQAEKADAYLQHDKEMIFKAITDSVGFQTVNVKVKDQLRSRYVETLKSIGDKTMREEDDVEAAALLNQIGNVMAEFRLDDESLQYMQKALEIKLEALGPDHLSTATSYNNIGSAYIGKGDHDRAIDYFEKALAIRLVKLGPDHPNTATTYNNIGSAYKSKGDHDKAIECYEKALGIRLATLGPDHPNTAISYNNIGSTYNRKGDYDKAIEYYEKSLAIKLATLGPNHSDTATSYKNVGSAYKSKGDHDKAIEFLQKALAIKLATLGPNHPHTAESYSSIGSAYDGKGDRNQAIVYFNKALEISHRDNSPEVGHLHFRLGETYLAVGQLQGARESFQRALTIFDSAFGMDNEQSRQCQDFLSKC